MLWLGLTATAIAAKGPQVVSAELGVGGVYKLGKWAPLRATIDAGDALAASSADAVELVAITPDSDGVGVATTTPGRRPVAIESGALTSGTTYVRVGRPGGVVDVRLYRRGREAASMRLPLEATDPQALAAGLAAGPATPVTETLWLAAGPPIGLAGTLDLVIGEQSWREASVGEVSSAADLPADPIGYDAFDAVVLTAGDWLIEVSEDDPRAVALRAWVRGGGRLVLSCGRLGQELLAPGGALSGLAPVEYDGPVTLSVADAIEAFADAPPAAGRIDLGDGSLSGSRVRVQDSAATRVLASAGRNERDTPLVVRAPAGFGEVTFVAFDLDAAPIARWEGRATLLARLLNVPIANDDRRGYAYGWDEIADSIVTRLDQTLSQVWSPPFLLIVGLTIAYLLLIGPGDYFLVKRVIGRVEATWVTFPLMVLVTSAAAYGAAYWLKGDRIRVNQFEVIDVDADRGVARGVLLTHVFSPRAQRYDLALAAREPSGAAYGDRLTASDTSWFARSRGFLGGMRGGGAAERVSRRLSVGYSVDPTPLLAPPTPSLSGPAVAGMPIPVWSAKTLVSRYEGRTDRAVFAELSATGDGLVTGAVTNDSGARLTGCRLLYGRWAWKLGSLADGQTATVESAPAPVTRKTMLGAVGRGRNASLSGLATLVSLTGPDVADDAPQNRLLAPFDLRPHLEAGRAVLLAGLADGEPCSELVRITPAGEPEPLVPEPEEASDDATPERQSWVFVRFLLPVDGG